MTTEKTNTISQEMILKLDTDILQAEKDWQAELARLDKEHEKVTKDWEKKTVKLQAERDAIALAIKLKDFPAKLVKAHKVCAVCGEPMRPFKAANAEGNVTKLWACSAGNLSALHDLVTVE